MSEVKLEWKGGLLFDVEQYGKHYHFDVSEEAGGSGKGISPKTVLLASLAGCTSMSAVSILQKMRVTDYKLIIEVQAEVADEHPKVFTDIEVSFNFTGDELPEDKVKKAVLKSVEKYCPVHTMLEKSTNISTRIFINEKEIAL